MSPRKRAAKRCHISRLRRFVLYTAALLTIKISALRAYLFVITGFDVLCLFGSVKKCCSDCCIKHAFSRLPFQFRLLRELSIRQKITSQKAVSRANLVFVCRNKKTPANLTISGRFRSISSSGFYCALPFCSLNHFSFCFASCMFFEYFTCAGTSLMSQTIPKNESVFKM